MSKTTLTFAPTFHGGRSFRSPTLLSHQQPTSTRVIDNLEKLGVRSLYVCSDLWITVKSTALNTKARDPKLKMKMKTMFEFEEHKGKHGGDDYDGDSWKLLFEKAADYVDKILSGTKAGDLPMYKL